MFCLDTDIYGQLKLLNYLVSFAQNYKTERTENFQSKSEVYSGEIQSMSVFWSIWLRRII